MTAERQRLLERLYAAVLMLYPADERTRFGQGMTYAFACDLERAQLDGIASLLAFLFTTLGSTCWWGLAARAAQLRPSSHRQQHLPESPFGDQTMRPLSRALLSVEWRDAWRSLRATPLVTSIAILSLGLGIGANTALFSILNSLIYKSLPVREPQQLVALQNGSWTNPIWEQIRDREPELSDGVFAWSTDSFDLAQGGQTDLVDGIWVSGRMFEVLGVSTVLGRPITPADDVRGGGKDGAVAVIGYGFWQRRYGGAADVIGRTLSLNRVPYTIIGVTPPSFFGTDVGRTFEVAIPIGTDPLMRGSETFLDRRSTWWLSIMARLKPGQTVEDITARIRGVQPQMREATVPQNWNKERQADYIREPFTFQSASTGESGLRRRYEQPLTAILIVVGLVLLIACANIANLLLARAVARRHELSVRLALGASRFRLVRQLLAESVLLAAAGAVLGMALAHWGSRLLVGQLATWNTVVYLDLTFDWRVLGFTMAVSMITAVLFGLAPAAGISSLAPNEALKEQGRGVGSDRRVGVRNGLVVVQVALSLTLVVAAGLFARTFYTLTTRDPGFDRDAILLVNANVQLPGQGGELAAERRRVFVALQEAVSGVPGVSHAAASFTSPLGSAGWNTPVIVPGRSGPTGRDRMSWVNAVTPGWFTTYGISVLAGRDVAATDRLGGPKVAIVNRAFAQRFFNEDNPIGKQFVTEEPGGQSAPYEIIGLAEDAVYRSIRAGMMPTMYVPFNQWERPGGGVAIGARAANGDPSALVRSVADAIGRVDPKATLTFRTLEDQVAATLTQEKLVARLSLFFGGLALLLAALGLYGVTSYSVSRRRAEIGIRIALGADASGVVRLVLKRVAWLVSIGVVGGTALSLWASQFATTLLFGLEARDPMTFAGAAALLMGIGLVAGWLPARRAARIDPTVILRE